MLRVRDGRVILAPNYGLTAADFDHTAPPVPVSAGVAAAAAPGGLDGRAASRKVRARARGILHTSCTAPSLLMVARKLFLTGKELMGIYAVC